LWLLLVPGLLVPGRDRRPMLEALVAVPLVTTSVLVAQLVAVDPRTQLFLTPLVAFYAARGTFLTASFLERRLDGRMRRGLPRKLLVGGICLALLCTSLTRLALSLIVG